MRTDNRQWLRIPHNTILPKLLLIVLLVIFTSYSVFLALTLQEGIIPDEPAHFTFSVQFASTWGIPEDVPQTLATGWYIRQNPFLNFWINGRALNLFSVFFPLATNWQMLVFLRLICVVYSLVTVYFCYLLAKEIIPNPWWQLLPVFLLTNTLMFVFLSGGLTYDNLANALCIIGLYFEVRVFNGKAFLTNSWAWIFMICLGTLVKYTILPLALFMAIAWIIYIILNKHAIVIRKTKKITLLQSLVLLIIIIANLSIYGVNLINYQSILPSCHDMFSNQQCEISPFEQRYQDLALDHKLSIKESIELGYPNPVEYLIDSWIPNMLYRIFGILGHQSYFPSHVIVVFRVLLFWLLLLAFRYISRPPFTIVSLTGIFILYAAVLFFINYNSELTYGFKQIAMQGRYIFPLIGAIYVLFSYIMMNVKNRFLNISTLVFTIGIFLLSGPIKFILYHNSIFSGWFRG